MPLGDRTGPVGAGPRTGRGLGTCPTASGTVRPRRRLKRTAAVPGRGLGRGGGPGRGLGRGFRGRLGEAIQDL